MVSDPGSFLYEGTGLVSDDTLLGLVGYEYDRIVDNGHTPPGFTRLARSPVIDAEGRPGWSEAGFYRAESGALVFAAGSIEWAFGLGHPRYGDPRIERMTANVLREALGVDVPEGVGIGMPPTRPAPTGPFVEVGTVVSGLDAPSDVAELPDGSLVVAAPRRNQILRIDGDGRVEVLAGDGNHSRNPAYDGVPGLRARFYHPVAVLTDEQGDVIVADTYNHVIRKILNDEERTVITLAGSMGVAGHVDGEGAEARFFMPMGLAFDPVSGDILVADAYNHRIRAIERGTWKVRTVAGNGPGNQDGPGVVARFSYPTAVAADEAGRIYAVATGNAKVIRVDPGADRTVTTLASGQVGWNDGNGHVGRAGPTGGAGLGRLVAPRVGAHPLPDPPDRPWFGSGDHPGHHRGGLRSVRRARWPRRRGGAAPAIGDDPGAGRNGLRHRWGEWSDPHPPLIAQPVPSSVSSSSWRQKSRFRPALFAP